MQKDEIIELLYRYKSGTATGEDMAFLESWYLQLNENDEKEYTPDERVADAEAIWDDLQMGQPYAKRLPLWPRIAAAASIILCLSIGGYFLLRKTDNMQVANSLANDIAPGGNIAILKLANGKSISLAEVKNGLLVQQNGAVISKAVDSELVYHDQSGSKATAMVYDTLTIPRGGHFQLALADGSKAWLNAASVIRYPESFSGRERQIELIKGEAYFEVVHNSAMPFKVVTHKQVVEDIGTRFNVNAYDDEPAVKTTLLEGSVKVSQNGRNVILKPGQQSFIAKSNPSITVKPADLDETVAWKNNHFVFNSEGIESIMRQISRWYDVDVSYEGDMSGKEFVGSISRFNNVSEVLRKLEETGTIHFRIEGRKIIVTP